MEIKNAMIERRVGRLITKTNTGKSCMEKKQIPAKKAEANIEFPILFEPFCIDLEIFSIDLFSN